MTRKLYAFGGVAIAAAIALTACTGTTTKTTSDGGTNLPAAASSALAELTKAAGGQSGALGGALSSLDVSKLCAAVSTADVQKLFKDTAPKVVANPGECDWGSGDITVDIDQNDTSKQFYPGGAFGGTEPALPGVGDKALWSAPVANMTLPFITSRKGNTDCSISPGLDVDKSSITYTGSDPFFKIADADELSYAQEEGQICNDLFKAGA